MTIELQIYRDFTHLYSGELPIRSFILEQRLFVGDSIATNEFTDPATVKSVVYHLGKNILVCYAIQDQPEILEKDVD
jgi:hypothetical protein